MGKSRHEGVKPLQLCVLRKVYVSICSPGFLQAPGFIRGCSRHIPRSRRDGASFPPRDAPTDPKVPAPRVTQPSGTSGAPICVSSQRQQKTKCQMNDRVGARARKTKPTSHCPYLRRGLGTRRGPRTHLGSAATAGLQLGARPRGGTAPPQSPGPEAPALSGWCLHATEKVGGRGRRRASHAAPGSRRSRPHNTRTDPPTT